MLDKLLKRASASHFFGGILLVAGTAIGAGMLALPVTMARIGFIPSLFVFFACWLLMLNTAFFLLDVNLSMSGNVNLISMAHKTLGLWGKIVSWVFYLLLLYALIAAYIAASGPLFQQGLFALTGWMMPDWISLFCLPLLFGALIYLGTEGVDQTNRVLMAGLVISYLLLIFLMPAHVDATLLLQKVWQPAYLTLPIVITSFGFHVIIPTLTTYMNYDRKHLRKTIMIGSTIPFLVYVLWLFLVFGVVPSGSLLAAYNEGGSAIGPLSMVLSSPLLSKGALFFSFFAIVTSFLGVSLSLGDFLIDGLKIKKGWEGRLMALGLVFIPPLFFLFTSGKGFLKALDYAGACVAILLGVLPSAMAWTLPRYRSSGKRFKLSLCIIFSLFIAWVSGFLVK